MFIIQEKEISRFLAPGSLYFQLFYMNHKKGESLVLDSILKMGEMGKEKTYFSLSFIHSLSRRNKNLKSTGVHDGIGMERWLGWSAPVIKLPHKVSSKSGVVSGWAGWVVGVG